MILIRQCGSFGLGLKPIFLPYVGPTSLVGMEKDPSKHTQIMKLSSLFKIHSRKNNSNNQPTKKKTHKKKQL